MKKTIAILLLISLLLCVDGVSYADTSCSFEVTITANYWGANAGLSSEESLFAPCLTIDVRNIQESAANQITVGVVFYSEAERKVWSEERYDLVINSDLPLRSGYSKTAFVCSSVGYQQKVNAALLPDISAEIYINKTLYGLISIEKAYESKAISVALVPEEDTQLPEGIGDSLSDAELSQPMKTAADFNPSEYTYEALEEILEKVTKELSSRNQNAEAEYQSTVGKSTDENEGIAIVCPSTIEKYGVTVEIKDLYIKCRNTESTQYSYDGNFLYATAEIKKVGEKESYFAMEFDMYDENDRYLGDFIILYTDNLDAKSVGKVINDNAILSATGVAKIVYKG